MYGFMGAIMEAGKTYKTVNGLDAHVLWKIKEPREGQNVYYVVLTDDNGNESNMILYFECGKRCNWTSLTFEKEEYDLVLEK